MKIIVLLLVILMTMACNNENSHESMTQRTRCESDALRSGSMMDTESCIVSLSVFSGRKNTVSEISSFYNLILVMCVNYAYEMTKCEKKSNLLPP
jgi:hypothetical protein